MTAKKKVWNYAKITLLVIIVFALVSVFANSMARKDRERAAQINLCIEHGYSPVYVGFNARFTGTCVRVIDGDSEVIKASDLE